MRRVSEHLSASDREIHDLLVSSKQRITEGVLREIARSRGIFFSANETREELAEKLSILPHDYFDIVDLIERRQSSSRGEKTTTVTLDVSVSQDELKEVLGSYQVDKAGDEVVKFNLAGTQSAVMEIDYNEFDFSKTRLAQRQPKEARIEFRLTKEGVSVRMPATEKARNVLASLQDKLGSLKKKEIDSKAIEVGALTSPALRTKFFTTLISKLPKYTYRTVTNVKVSPGVVEEEDEELTLEDGEAAEKKEEILSYVRSVAMSGENLAVSPEYKQLLESGYFVTAITWKAEHRESPYHLIRFDAGFEKGAAGTGFRYSIRYAPRLKDGTYSTTFRSFDAIEKEQHLQALESFARVTLDALLKEMENGEAAKLPVADAGVDAEKKDGAG